MVKKDVTNDVFNVVLQAIKSNMADQTLRNYRVLLDVKKASVLQVRTSLNVN